MSLTTPEAQVSKGALILVKEVTWITLGDG